MVVASNADLAGCAKKTSGPRQLLKEPLASKPDCQSPLQV